MKQLLFCDIKSRRSVGVIGINIVSKKHAT